jgi:hypothetical protein
MCMCLCVSVFQKNFIMMVDFIFLMATKAPTLLLCLPWRQPFVGSLMRLCFSLIVVVNRHHHRHRHHYKVSVIYIKINFHVVF